MKFEEAFPKPDWLKEIMAETDEIFQAVKGKRGLGELQDVCGEAANKNGWHDDFPQRENYADAAFYKQAVTLWVTAKAGLIAAEAHEAVEELRGGNEPHKVYYNGTKPEGFGIELADVIIRSLDLAWVLGIDLEELVAQKLKANELRGTRHGGKVL